MNINIKDYLLDFIGDIGWHGDSHYDSESAINMEKADKVLFELESIRDEILSALNDHKVYREGNGSAEHLHSLAGKILYKHLEEPNFPPMSEKEFEDYWNGK